MPHSIFETFFISIVMQKGSSVGEIESAKVDANSISLSPPLSSFRWDYLRRFAGRGGGSFPGFDKFRQGGVETEYLESVFPSESFPAWQTINTGIKISSKY